EGAEVVAAPAPRGAVVADRAAVPGAGAARREALRERRAAHVLAHLARRARAVGVALEPRGVAHVERARAKRGRHASQSITHHSLPPRTSAPPPASGTTATRASTRARGAVRDSAP